MDNDLEAPWNIHYVSTDHFGFMECKLCYSIVTSKHRTEHYFTNHTHDGDN